MDAIAKAPRQSFRMRGRSFVALAFCPVVPIAGWLEEIDVTLARSPGFFAGKPVVLDLSAVDLSQSAIAHLITSLEQRNIHILGIEGVDWRTNADCAARLICWECCGQRSLLWYRGISCSIRKRSPSRWTGASMSRRISCGRCSMIADSDSDIPGPGFSSERTVVRRRPLKSLDLGPASPVY